MRTFLTIALATSVSFSAHAQTPSDKKFTSEGIYEIQKNKVSGLTGSPNVSGVSGAQIKLFDNDSTAILQFSDETVSNFNKDGTKASSHGWELTLSTPLSDNKNAKPLATLDRLSSGTKAGLKYTRGFAFNIKNNFSDARLFREFLNIAEKNCRQANENNPNIDKECKIPYDASGDELDIFIDTHAPDIDPKNFELDVKHVWFTTSANMGYDDYEFLNTTDLSAIEEQEFSYNAGVAITYTQTKMPWSFSIGANFESAFEQAPEKENCLNIMGMMECATGRLGAPVRTDNILAYTEIRQILNVGFGPIKQIALAPRVTHNFDKNLTGINMPVYLIQENDGLSSGFQLGWRSDTKDVSAGIFIGGSFDFLK